MKSMVVKAIYGPGETYQTARELVEHLESIGAVTFSHENVFQQRDDFKKEVNKLEIIIESLVAENKRLKTNTE